MTSNSIKIKNIGNLNNKYMTGLDENSGNYVNLNEISLPSNQSSDVNLSYRLTVLTLDSNGTITDDSRIQPGNNGKGYFAIEKFNE